MRLRGALRNRQRISELGREAELVFTAARKFLLHIAKHMHGYAISKVTQTLSDPFTTSTN